MCCSGSRSTRNNDEAKESMRKVDEILQEIKESRKKAIKITSVMHNEFI